MDYDHGKAHGWRLQFVPPTQKRTPSLPNGATSISETTGFPEKLEQSRFGIHRIDDRESTGVDDYIATSSASFKSFSFWKPKWRKNLHLEAPCNHGDAKWGQWLSVSLCKQHWAALYSLASQHVRQPFKVKLQEETEAISWPTCQKFCIFFRQILEEVFIHFPAIPALESQLALHAPLFPPTRLALSSYLLHLFSLSYMHESSEITQNLSSKHSMLHLTFRESLTSNTKHNKWAIDSLRWDSLPAIPIGPPLPLSKGCMTGKALSLLTSVVKLIVTQHTHTECMAWENITQAPSLHCALHVYQIFFTAAKCT